MTPHLAHLQAATGEYVGYATLTSECVDSGKTTKETVYIEAQWPEGGWERCPWPEILPGSPGYNSNFTFTQGPASAAPDASSAPLAPAVAGSPPAPQQTGGLPAALQCVTAAGISVTDDADAGALKEASQVWNLLNSTTALAVVYPADADQLQTAVRCLYQNGVPAVPRSGGHSYQGYSVLADAVTVDLRKLNYVTVTADKATAKVGSGARLGELYYQVADATGESKGAVGGTCPPIGVGGLLLGNYLPSPPALPVSMGLECNACMGARSLP